MNWQHVETLDWREPLDLARDYAESDMALLYSGIRETFSGGHSYLFLNPLEEIFGDDWAKLPPLPPAGDPLPLWIGYLSYGMRDATERGTPSPVTMPNFRLVRYETMIRFDHKEQAIERYQALPQKKLSSPLTTDYSPLTVSSLTSNLTRAEYERIVAETIEKIRDGDFYQANITRKFFGEFMDEASSRARPGIPDHLLKPASGDPGIGFASLRFVPGRRDDGLCVNSFQLFETLCNTSPAPYSAYIKHGSSAILSSSPECFLTVDTNGIMTTRPIKGSARRSTDDAEDKTISNALVASTKNHAENLMIVDLMRNDLSRVSEPMSVEVIEQSALYSYRTIHHLISTIRAKKHASIRVYDAVRACFPAGSMTGAPKIAAMKWCAEKEKFERGVYSGAIGWFGAGDTCDLSVVIRTLIIDGNRFEFQVGGGIVADSTPEDEWRETLAKARGICAALGLGEDDLAKI